ncbi:MAG: NAD(P)H dehydrogenase (quinone) [Methanocella sp. PtaU1.Bin125]|nr:MAG: NAD(P)H dehydrogenase (quinone) [Methanocella sp. PtaU1.Bin125]
MIHMVEKPRILIIYTSMSGNTEALARAIADGARHGQNVEVEIKRAGEVTPQDIARAAALAFGSPTYFSYMSGELKSLFDGSLPFKEHFEGKPAIAFGTGNGGQLKCIESIENILSYFGVRFVQKSDILSAGLAVQGAPDAGTKRLAAQAGKSLTEAGVRYVCEKAKQEQGIVIGEHTAGRDEKAMRGP